MNILFYTPIHLRYGSGFEEWLKKTCLILSKKNIISIACGNIGAESFRWSKNTVIKNYKSSKNIFYLNNINIFSVVFLPNITSMLRMYKIFKKVDIVYYNYSFFLHDIYIFLMCKLTRKKLVIGFHAPILFDNFFHNLYFTLVTSFLLNFVNGIHVNNTADQALLIKKTKKPVFFIPNYILKKEVPKKSSQKYKGEFVFAGRYDYQKGIDVLINAIKIVIEKNNLLKFVFFGKGRLVEIINKLKNNFPNNIFINGYEPNKEIIFSSKSFVLLPSRQETFSMIPLEAMARGVPVITTFSHGQIDIISNNEDGLFIKKLTPQSLAETILFASKIIKNKYLQISNNARQKIINKYTEESFLLKFSKMLSSI